MVFAQKKKIAYTKIFQLLLEKKSLITIRLRRTFRKKRPNSTTRIYTKNKNTT
jgi:hypothetical protein